MSIGSEGRRLWRGIRASVYSFFVGSLTTAILAGRYVFSPRPCAPVPATPGKDGSPAVEPAAVAAASGPDPFLMLIGVLVVVTAVAAAVYFVRRRIRDARS